MKTYVAVVSLMLTIGCTAMPKVPETVYVPTYISCVGNRPVKPESSIPRNESVSERVRSLLIDMERMQAYEAELEAVIDGCL
jgi:hypothetical protein